MDDEGETNKRERAKKNVREIRAMRSAVIVIVFHDPWPTRPELEIGAWSGVVLVCLDSRESRTPSQKKLN